MKKLFIIPLLFIANNLFAIDVKVGGVIISSDNATVTAPGGFIGNCTSATWAANGGSQTLITSTGMASGQNFFNDIKVSSAIYADHSGDSGTTLLYSTGMASGQNFLNDITVSTAMYATTALNAPGYLPLSGGTMSGSINVGTFGWIYSYPYSNILEDWGGGMQWPRVSFGDYSDFNRLQFAFSRVDFSGAYLFGITSMTATDVYATTYHGDGSGISNVNAATVTNGVYTNGSYSNPSWLTGLQPLTAGTTQGVQIDANTSSIAQKRNLGQLITSTDVYSNTSTQYNILVTSALYALNASSATGNLSGDIYNLMSNINAKRPIAQLVVSTDIASSYSSLYVTTATPTDWCVVITTPYYNSSLVIPSPYWFDATTYISTMVATMTGQGSATVKFQIEARPIGSLSMTNNSGILWTDGITASTSVAAGGTFYHSSVSANYVLVIPSFTVTGTANDVILRGKYAK